MPNAKVLAEKQEVVRTLEEKLRSLSGVLVDYKGISVAEDTEMRAKMRTLDIDYSVVKNTLLRFAIKSVGFEALDSVLNGTTSLAIHKTDAVAPAKLIKEYSGKLDKRFNIKGGFYDGKVLSIAEVESLASIPALPVLQAQLLGTMLAPIAKLAIVIKAIVEKGGGTVDAAPVEEAADTAPVEEASAPVETTDEAPAAEVAAETETPADEAPAEDVPAAE